MTIHAFARYDLRTTDPDGARKFYSMALGLEFDPPPPTHAPKALEIWPLHERARARGAPAHWLGSIGVTNVDVTARRLMDLGSEELGPPVRDSGGPVFAALRDPLGAVMAIREGVLEPQHSIHSIVGWHQLHTQDADRAWAIYSELFGWSHTETLNTADVYGGHRLFSWEPGGDSSGSIANTARWPGVHVHWLFHFRVANLDDTIAKVRLNGGNALAPIALPNGHRVVACEDPQGAAFGLIQPA